MEKKRGWKNKYGWISIISFLSFVIILSLYHFVSMVVENLIFFYLILFLACVVLCFIFGVKSFKNKENRTIRRWVVATLSFLSLIFLLFVLFIIRAFTDMKTYSGGFS